MARARPKPHPPARPGKKPKNPGQGQPGGQTTTVTSQDASLTADYGNPAMDTSASTTAPYTQTDAAANQSDAEMQAFFSSGHGAAEHYDYAPGAGVGQENPSTMTGAGG